MPYCTKADLDNALGVQIVKAIFDDDADGTVDAAPMAACLEYGSEECDSFLRDKIDGVTFPIDPTPASLKFAAVDFCCAYAARRRPDVMRAMGEEPWTAYQSAAIDKIKRFATAEQRLALISANGTPVVVGGEVVTTADEADEADPPNGSWWEDMADYSK